MTGAERRKRKTMTKKSKAFNAEHAAQSITEQVERDYQHLPKRDWLELCEELSAAFKMDAECARDELEDADERGEDAPDAR